MAVKPGSAILNFKYAKALIQEVNNYEMQRVNEPWHKMGIS